MDFLVLEYLGVVLIEDSCSLSTYRVNIILCTSNLWRPDFLFQPSRILNACDTQINIQAKPIYTEKKKERKGKEHPKRFPTLASDFYTHAVYSKHYGSNNFSIVPFAGGQLTIVNGLTNLQSPCGWLLQWPLLALLPLHINQIISKTHWYS